MEWQIENPQDTSWFVVRLGGVFRLDDLEACYRELLDRPDWTSGSDIFWDARACDFSDLDLAEIEQIAQMTERYRERRGHGRGAWLVSRDVDFGISRMFELLSEGKVPFTFRVFRVEDEATTWLKSPSTGSKR